MSWQKITCCAALGVLMLAGATMAGEISAKLSGPGMVNDSTIKVGEPVSLDLYFSNDTLRRGVSVGFKFTSPDIKKIIHVADSGNGVNENGDVKGVNGWQDKSVFDLTGIIVSANDWDGNLPDTVGLVGIVIKKRWQPHDLEKKISINFIVPDPGTLSVDSTFFPPGGKWMYDNNEKPGWDGPYTFKVVK